MRTKWIIVETALKRENQDIPEPDEEPVRGQPQEPLEMEEFPDDEPLVLTNPVFYPTQQR